MKKIVKYGIGAVVVGGVTAGITIPVVNAVNSKKDVIKHIDMTQEAWAGMTLQQLVDGVKEEERVSGSILTDISKAATFRMYDEEQKGSIELQKRYFDFKLSQIVKERTELEAENSNSATTAARKTQIKDKLDQLKKDEDTTNENKNKLNSLKKEDYESSSFSTTFPHVLTTREIIKEKQTKIYADNKKSFVDQFSTKEEGEKAWIDELKKKYNGATNEGEAVAMIVYGIIKKDAYGSYNYELNGTYTKEMMDATYVGGTNKIFDFLKGAKYKALVSEPSTTPGVTNTGTKNDKVYFISTKSHRPDKIAVSLDKDTSGKFDSRIEDMASSKLVHISHALLPVKQNTISATLPWDITKEELIGGAKGKTAAGFISLYGTGADKHSFIESLPGLFDEKSTDTTQTAIDGVKADNFFIEKSLTQPTASKDGSLGVKGKIESVKGMAPGFKIGLIEAMHELKEVGSGSVDTAAGDKIIADIVKGVKDVMTKESIDTQAQLVAYINSLSKDEVTNVFGGIFRDAFKGKPKLYYLLSDHSFIVRSTFGIHFIKMEDYSNPQILVDQINKDLDNAAKDQAISKVIINYTQLFAQSATTDKVIKDIFSEPSIVADLKAGYEKNKDDKTGEELSDQMKKVAGSPDAKMLWTELLAAKDKAIENVLASMDLNEVMSSLGTGIQKFLEEKFDADLIDGHVYQDATHTSVVVSAKKIYDDALELEA